MPSFTRESSGTLHVAVLGVNRIGKRLSLAGGRAAVAEAEGNLAEAESFYRDASSRIKKLEPRDKRNPSLTSDLARVLARQGRLVEAELAARDAVNGIFLSDVRREAVAGNVMRVFSEVLYQMGRYQEAEKVARAAISVHQKIARLRTRSRRRWRGAAWPTASSLRNDGTRPWPCSRPSRRAWVRTGAPFR